MLFAGGSFFDWFPLRGLYVGRVRNVAVLAVDHRSEEIVDYFWHLALPLTAMALSAFATTTLLTKNSFLDEIRKQYVMTARAKGLTERPVLYGHVFRNAMLMVIAGFPGAFIRRFFAGSLLIETIFSLDGLGLLGFKSVVNRDYPVIFATLYIFSLIGLRREPHLRPHLHLDRSAHRFRDARGLSVDQVLERQPPRDIDPAPGRRTAAAEAPRCRRSTSGAGRISRQPARLLVAVDLPDPVRRCTLFAEFIANDRPIVVSYKGEILFPVFVDYPETKFGGFLATTDYRDPFIQDEINANGWMIWPPIRYSYRTVNNELPSRRRRRRGG